MEVITEVYALGLNNWIRVDPAPPISTRPSFYCSLLIVNTTVLPYVHLSQKVSALSVPALEPAHPIFAARPSFVQMVRAKMALLSLFRIPFRQSLLSVLHPTDKFTLRVSRKCLHLRRNLLWMRIFRSNHSGLRPRFKYLTSESIRFTDYRWSAPAKWSLQV